MYRLWYILYSWFGKYWNSNIRFLDKRESAYHIHPYLHKCYISWCYTIKDLQESTILRPPNPTLTPAQSFRVALDYLVSSDSPTYHDVSAHTCARFSLAYSPSSSYRIGCSSWSRIDPVGPGFTTTKGFGLRLSRISLKDFRRSSRTARRRPQRRSNEDSSSWDSRATIWRRKIERRRKRIFVSLEGKKIFIGSLVVWRREKRRGRAGNEDLNVHWRYRKMKTLCSRKEEHR